jgi:ABC-type multidrug transport system permease subunit
MSSPRARAFLALCDARFREFFRESEAVFWTFVFPVVLTLVLALAFRNRPVETLPVAVVDGPGAAAVAAALRTPGHFEVRTASQQDAFQALRTGKAALVVLPREGGAAELRLDPTRSESVLARHEAEAALQRAAGRKDAVSLQTTEISEPGSRYIDFLIPGLIGLGLMNGGMWGVGFHLVDMRIKRLLKRLLATPMRRGDFLLAQMTLRVAASFVEVAFLLLFARLALGVPFRGSWPAVLAVGALGALVFGGLGLLLASRARRIETVMGLMNVVSLPMTIGSGVFFSVERFPALVQPAIRLLPLTALIDALRAVISEGAPLASQAAPLAILAGWGVLSFVAGLRLFRWS